MKRLIESLAISGLIVTAVPVPASAQAPVDDAARLPGVAYEILDRADAKEALPCARAAARLAPEQGIAELEESARRDPDVRDVQLALAQAYAKAGRAADVQRVREKLLELETHSGAH